MSNSNTHISKKISYILRHDLNNIKHTNEGYVQVKMLMKKVNCNLDKINEIVSTDKKNRYNLKTIGHMLYIRANQGHTSGNLNDEIMLERIEKPIIRCYHGTYKNKIGIIQKNGLSRMSRKHIHIAESDEAISGKRSSCNVKIYINMEKALNDGIKFYRSSNGVILTPGDENGIIDPKYFDEVKFI